LNTLTRFQENKSLQARLEKQLIIDKQPVVEKKIVIPSQHTNVGVQAELTPSTSSKPTIIVPQRRTGAAISSQVERKKVEDSRPSITSSATDKRLRRVSGHEDLIPSNDPNLLKAELMLQETKEELSSLRVEYNKLLGDYNRLLELRPKSEDEELEKIASIDLLRDKLSAKDGEISNQVYCHWCTSHIRTPFQRHVIMELERRLWQFQFNQ